MPDEDGLIAAHYRIDPARPGPVLAGGLRAYTVTDRRDPALALMAIETRVDLPARPRIGLSRGGPPVPFAVLPIEYGLGRDASGRPGWFIVADALPGKAMGLGRGPLRDADLAALVLQPAATALLALQTRGLTHRAINPDNLFRAGPSDPVTLGPFWAAPPASLQPAIFEPPYMAVCVPTGRGDGVIADDIYALGVTMLCLALGRLPLEHLDDAAVLRRKLHVGSFAALTEGVSLSPLLADLLSGMLAEDPDHRLSPALLLKPEQARARRVAARAPRRAQQPLTVGNIAVSSARELAFAMGQLHDRAYPILKNGDVERWIRRGLGDAHLGMQVEELMRRADAGSPIASGRGAPDRARPQAGSTTGPLQHPPPHHQVLMRCVAVLDPLAPLFWRGTAVQPDGIGAALVGAAPELASTLEEIVTADAITQFATDQRRPDHAGLREEQLIWRSWLSARGPAGGWKRVTYAMNPNLACASPLLGGRPVVRAADLLPALDEAASNADRTRPPIDAHIAAFLSVRADSTLVGELLKLTSFAGPGDRLAVLRLFGRLQMRLCPGALPALAGWLMTCGFATLDDWLSNKTRAELQLRVADAAGLGQISTILELVDDDAARRADRAGAAAAAVRVRQLTSALSELKGDAPRRAEAARLLGTELVAGAGLIASLGATLALALQ